MTADRPTHASPPFPRWMTWVLLAAGVYNVLWGAFVVLFPSAVFRWVGMEQPNYPWLWQCIGMIVGVYGIGYAVAARDPLRHWPIVLVGFLGKVFGPIGFADALVRGVVPPAFGVNIIFNDLIWWVPFALILFAAWRHHSDPGVGRPTLSPGDAMARATVHDGPTGAPTLLDLSQRGPVLAVFLRHFGCTFCREALADVSARRREIEASGARLVLVHMSPPGEAPAVLARYGLSGTAHVSDPSGDLYRAFELRRGTIGELFGLRVWARGVAAGVFKGHGVGRLRGDGFQMPGVFLVERGRIVKAYRHRDASDRVDVCTLTPAGAGVNPPAA